MENETNDQTEEGWLKESPYQTSHGAPDTCIDACVAAEAKSELFKRFIINKDS